MQCREVAALPTTGMSRDLIEDDRRRLHHVAGQA